MKKRFLSVVTISALVALGTFAVTSCQPETPVETTKYKVTYSTGGGYNLTGLKTEGYAEGETVTFKVEPDSGKRVTEVKAGSETLTANASGEYSFTMGTSDVTITVTVEDISTDATITLDKETIRIDELGKTETITATVTNFTGTIEWTTTDATKISITPSADGKTCTVTNVGGGSAVVTATAGTAKANVAVTGSTYGDTRKSYTIYNANGDVILDDVKGLWNAIGKLEANTARLNGYITEKGSEDVIYTCNDHWLKSMGKNGKTTEVDGLPGFENGDVPGWFSGYPTAQADDLQEANIIVGQKASGSYKTFNGRATNWDESLFADKGKGYYTSTDGKYPGNDVYSGWRGSYYIASVTTAQYVSWADAAKWSAIDISWDLSNSTITPSYNEEQGAFAQLYVGSSFLISKFSGMYFYAGTMEENKNLEDGTTRDIYTFTETLGKGSDALITAKFGADRTINEEVSIGKAVWDSFNKVWTFPDVTINLRTDIYFTGEDTENPTANYHRVNTITGYSDGEKVNSVEYDFDYGQSLPRIRNEAGESQQERTDYGASLTPEYGDSIADLNCGAKWTNLVQTKSAAYDLEDKEIVNLQFFEGRTVNSGCQTALLGSDCLTGYLDANRNSVYNFEY